jgi:hypothetical protein
MRKIKSLVLSAILVTSFIGCGSNKSTAKILKQSDFNNFGHNPWEGVVSYAEGDFISTEILIKKEQRDFYGEFTYYYTSPNCWWQRTQKASVFIFVSGAKSIQNYVGKKIKIYGTISTIEIGRPKDACDYAWIHIFLNDEKIESINK